MQVRISFPSGYRGSVSRVTEQVLIDPSDRECGEDPGDCVFARLPMLAGWTIPSTRDGVDTGLSVQTAREIIAVNP
jgi:hypothetical protein